MWYGMGLIIPPKEDLSSQGLVSGIPQSIPTGAQSLFDELQRSKVSDANGNRGNSGILAEGGIRKAPADANPSFLRIPRKLHPSNESNGNT